MALDWRARSRGRRRTLAIAHLSAMTALSSDPAGAKTGDPAPEATAASSAAIVPPKLVHFVQADFPPSQVAAGHGAVVVLEIAIDGTGQVVRAVVVESAGTDFDAAAVRAARQFVFEPAMRGDKPVPVKVTYRYAFTITETLVRKTKADFAGVVRNRRTKAPIARVRVSLDTGQQALTTDQGTFGIEDVTPGEHQVRLEGESTGTLSTSEIFEPSKRLDVTYDVNEKSGADSDDEEQIVTFAPRLKKQAVSTEVQASQAEKVPGTQGDVLKVVENLPGVARAAVGSGAIVVWGASPQDTRVYVDGVHVPRLYHDGGYRSILPSDFVKSVELLPGGYGPAYGRSLGGIVTVTMRPLDDEGVHGSAGADLIDVSADLRANLGAGVHAAVAARKSYLDAVLAAVTSEDVGNYVPIPRYWDAQARVAFDLAPHEGIEVGAFASSDRIDHVLVNPDPALTTRQTASTDFQRFYVRYQKHMEEGSIATVEPWFGFDSTGLVNVFGTTPTALENDSTLVGLRADWRGPIAPWIRAEVGLDAELTLSRLHQAGSIGAPPREGDVSVFGEPPPSQVDEDDWKTTLLGLGAYAEADMAWLRDRLHVVTGLRFEPLLYTANKTVPTEPDTAVGTSRREDTFDPRVSVRFAVSPRMVLKAAFGSYHQMPEPEDLSAAFGTPSLVVSTAQHYLAGSTFDLADGLSIDTTAFFTTSQDLVVRSDATTPRAAQVLQAAGYGRSYGTQFLLRQQERGRFFGWVSYTIMRSERKDGPTSDWRLFDYDQTHVFTALASYDLGAGFEVSARFRYATGYPRTSVTGSYFDALTDTYEPTFGAHNGTRIPPFVALDLRGAKQFKWGPVRAECYLDVQNVTNHANPEELVYNTTFVQRATITGMPILPVLGARVQW